ncbi:MAG: hypothetical protein A2509_08255 [Candidatus Edwardsbacteria bacterium RIFOXYD12_FULL_50_11]|uniref:DUF5667 domain-containing protein n=1 Tax=Candidatus Edwardsbacteria bacterium GWF2_54_11 TaxID=1817851 RepID=A0A1F5RGZ2_9BACT|nr:MAG: hypothetical protein A2502_01620 [Candidatus Edwardsbacteria bacterium RifOxyC12_full_54_24]OGF08966.1 MAG: hypothetical protein A2273_10075 [Candidatus Edwardsbacteria bacterium RifOxyA12_full_54_48]OGF12505.1 MAG: hypothetical protein A3K15_01505 [Candidatus Edwardsbacteria bacterium GWE2_54_12]OGF13652.1 MAG: hypothetical protein A2024_10960 [Candidatus Edwardsbacteria bacterium GWF2_54_11]OGF17390.1 MAG: hypothetical protein A2509_08255 [Candidatus Edwardsbacteria bacterium RIFOXYD1
MKQKAWAKCTAMVLTLTIMAALGCGKKKAAVSQGITPNVLNFYILHQEIGAIRGKVGASTPEQKAQYLPSYNELIGRSQKMIQDNQTSQELKKYPAIDAAMDSCLNAGVAFLILEAKAVETISRLADVKQQLSDLRQSTRNNSLLAKKQKPKMDALAKQQASLQKQLDGHKPGLSRNSQTCRALLKSYNNLVLQGKILEYTNDVKLFALFSWEKPAPVKTVKKKRK